MQVIESGKWMDGKERKQLPIDNRLDKIIRLSQDNQVVIVEADTGAGKTTRIPQAILLANPKEKIWMTSLRRNAVRSIGRQIAMEMGCQPGELVGWKLSTRGGSSEKIISKETRLVMMVDQSLANQIVKSGKLPEGVVIVDEAHDRNVAIDTLLGLIKIHLPQSPKTRVLITSATIDTKKFSEFFDNAPVVSVEGRCYPVDVNVYRLSPNEHHSQGAGNAATQIVLERFIEKNLIVDDKVVSKGAVIILLPGKEDIDNVSAFIKQETERIKCEDRVEILTLFGGSAPSEDDAVQTPVPDGKIRFVCATEVLRSQRTIPEVIGVIDSLQVKRKITTPQGAGRLKKISVSKAEADQAKGRAGRTSSGFYIPISFESEYDFLEPYPQPAILREPISSVVLQLAHTGISVREFPFIDKPTDEHIEVAVSRLKKMGAINNEEHITDVGRLLLQFSVDPESAMSLVAADKLGVLPEAVIVSSIRENEGVTFFPKKNGKMIAEEWLVRFVLRYFEKSSWGEWECKNKPCEMDKNFSDLPEWIVRKGEWFEIDYAQFPVKDGARWIADKLHCYFAGNGQSDFVAFVRMYRAYKAEERRLKDVAQGERNSGQQKNYNKKFDWRYDLRQWCQARFLNFKKLEFIDGTIGEIKEALKNSPLKLQNSIAEDREFDISALTKAMMSGMVDNIVISNGSRNYCGAIGSVSLAYQSVCKGGDIILIGHPTKIPTKRGGYFLLANEAAPIQLEWLEDILPSLCSHKRLGDFYYNQEQDEIWETKNILFMKEVVGQKKVLAVASEAVERCFVLAFAKREFSEAGPVLERNLKVRKEYELLNIRSGGLFQRFTEQDEYDLYEREIIGKGIVSVRSFEQAVYEGKVNIKNLFIEPPKKEDKERIEQKNPETVVIDSVTFPVTYSKCYYSETFYAKVAVEMEKEFVYTTKAKSVKLPSGRELEIVCGIHSASTFPELVGKLLSIDCYNELSIPHEKPWIGFNDWGSYVDTPGKLLESKMKELVQEHVKNPKANSMAGRIDSLKDEIIFIRQLLLQEYSESEAQIEKTEIELRSLISLMQDEKFKADWELRIHSDIVQAKEKLNACNFEAVNEICNNLDTDIRKKYKDAQGSYTEFRRIWCCCGNTNSGDGWVICPDGTFRQHDLIDAPRPRYSYEGYKSWDMVFAGEVALSWKKATSASEHIFETHHMPESLTAEQVKSIEDLLEKIESEWEGCSGLSSGIQSPSVGVGWFNPETGERLASLDFQTTRQKRENTKRTPKSLSGLSGLQSLIVTANARRSK